MSSNHKLVLVVVAGIVLVALTSIWFTRQFMQPPLISKVLQIDQGSYTNITPQNLATMLQTKDFKFINVHIPYEGEIANTDAKIAYNEIGQNLTLLPADKSARIVLYCRSGRMGTIAAQQLVKLGYTHVFNLDGGMIAWEQAGYLLLNH